MDVLREVAKEPEFALKGGTAINLFFRDVPRLSVDIDLAWLPLSDRVQALAAIEASLGRIGAAAERTLRCQVHPRRNGEDVLTGLGILRDRVPIKIDVTPVLRGSVYPAELRALQPAAAEAFGFVEVQTLGFADVYAGKLAAALDRQHPRDLFDVMHLQAAEGVTETLWSAFLVYLVAHNRPAAELLAPNHLDLEAAFFGEFAGMTDAPVTVAMLARAREDLIATVQGRLDDRACDFLLSVEREAPDWGALALPEHVPDLPAIRWKLLNMRKRSSAKRQADYRNLAQTLEHMGRKGSA